jgi:hypothetical protein
MIRFKNLFERTESINVLSIDEVADIRQQEESLFVHFLSKEGII